MRASGRGRDGENDSLHDNNDSSLVRDFQNGAWVVANYPGESSHGGGIEGVQWARPGTGQTEELGGQTEELVIEFPAEEKERVEIAEVLE